MLLYYKGSCFMHRGVHIGRINISVPLEAAGFLSKKTSETNGNQHVNII